MSSLVIVGSLSLGISPLTTPSLRLGLFLSFRLTKRERILALYAAVVPSKWVYAADSMSCAFLAMMSTAGHWSIKGEVDSENATHEHPNRTPKRRK